MNAIRSSWRTLIVDDEPLAREGIRTRLAALGGFEIVGECGGGRAAVDAIRSRTPDVVFLDVQMPVLDGFGVIAEIGADAMPAIVFVTAHDQHALRAFDAQAIDYVLKPIDDARFVRAVDGVRRRLARSARQRRRSAAHATARPGAASRRILFDFARHQP